MKKLRIFIIIISFLIFYHTTNADSWMPFTIQRYVSPNKKYEVFLDNKKHAKLFKIAEQCQLILEFEVPVLPRSAYVPNNGRFFVIVDTYGGNNEEIRKNI
ncbi:MAG: hypothetical protein ACTSQY_11820 [Candidatus Odinarchaeia archaeon]